MNEHMEDVRQHPMMIMFKQCYSCQIIYGHEEVPTPSNGISHGVCDLCLAKEQTRLGLEKREPIVFTPSGPS